MWMKHWRSASVWAAYRAEVLTENETAYLVIRRSRFSYGGMCMRTAVYFEGRRAGSLDWRQESGGVRVVLDCELCSACILRVYAETEGAARSMSVCPSRRAAGCALQGVCRPKPCGRPDGQGKNRCACTLPSGRSRRRVSSRRNVRRAPSRRAPSRRVPGTPCLMRSSRRAQSVRNGRRTGSACPVRFRRTSRSPSRRPSCCAARSRGERCSTGKQKAQPNRLRPQKWIDFYFTIAFASR